MDQAKIIKVQKSVFSDNDAKAEEVRQQLKQKGCFLLNVMSSPGSGKTTLLTQVINRLKDDYRIGVMEADIDGDIDANDIIKNTGVEAIQLHTGGMCHLDAGMTSEGLENLEGELPELIFMENVGNLVCPASFDTGSSRNLVILSVPEGDDKPLKYPKMFEVADVVVINKMDAISFFDFDMNVFEGFLRPHNSKCQVIPLSAKTGEGVEQLVDWLTAEITNWRK
ncbi:MAG: hydrogenase nickel incorporation protein HypB [Eubacteriales bacterium]|nr:hydrogenase nickel incorporation protein HypB [Eubacteriales bacterium]